MGVVIAAGGPLFMAYVSSAHGVSAHAQDSSRDLGDFVSWVVFPLVIASFAMVVWLEMVRRGELAWLWAMPWAMFAAFTLSSVILGILTGAFGDPWFGTAILSLDGSQMWVAWKAWKLSKDIRAVSGESTETNA